MHTTITVPADPVVSGHHRWRIVAALAVTSTIALAAADMRSGTTTGRPSERESPRKARVAP
ncbi:hypothetical protein IW248_004463 [Micromonospora ureilytica]|uniref:Uncharacterized protein n=1 Tax=Micromonospora ureilytica TaxID=709868 RepID=A0ABS0JMF4_9ACTN|nr:hypothetical protein [Micromonospora ureilytica]